MFDWKKGKYVHITARTNWPKERSIRQLRKEAKLSSDKQVNTLKIRQTINRHKARRTYKVCNCNCKRCAKNRNIYSVFYRILYTQLNCQVVSQNVVKFTPVTD